MTSLSADAVALRLLDRFSASDTASVTAPTSDNATMSTPMPVALGDKPTRRSRTVTTPTETQIPTPRRSDQSAAQSAKTHVTRPATTIGRVPTSVSTQLDPAHRVQDSAQTETTPADANLAAELIASGVTTQPVETVIAVLGTPPARWRMWR